MSHSVPPEVLVVDLDGTLLRSDMLYETFWAAFSADWRTPLRAALALRSGKAALKRVLAQAAGQIDPALLPYDDEVLAYIRRWRADGGRTALVTATDADVAQAIAAHLDLFDEVHGSDGTRNLKGAHKAAFLRDRFGARGFAYMGDHEADLKVWEHAHKAVAVNAPTAVKRQAAQLDCTLETIDSHPREIKPYLKAIRPHQWAKNVLVFLPMLAAHQLTALTLLQSFLAFVAFSLVASSVYVLNDMLDLASDRSHPRKRARPFAAGRIPLAHGTWMAPGMLLAGFVVAAFLGWDFLLVMAGYYAVTTAYSLYLKRRLIIDICTLAGLYTIRIVAGGAATDIALSVWLLAFSIFIFLSLAAVKRQAELVDGRARGALKAHGRGYHVEDLPLISAMAIASGYVAVLVMALYLNSPDVNALYGYPPALWGICLVLLYWISRMVMVTHRGWMHDDPVVYAVKDRGSRLCLAVILVFALAGTVL